MPKRPFAIEIGEQVTRIADARFENDVVFLQALGSTETTQSYLSGADSELQQQKQAHIIHSLVSDLKITTKQVNVVIPDTMAFAQIIETPILPEKDLVSAIRYQADEFIPMNIDDTYLDLEILHQDDKAAKLSLLIVAAPKRLVDGIYKTIELVGLEPMRLETEVSCVGRLVSEVMRAKQVDTGYLIVNFGYIGSSIYLIDTATNSLVFHRSCKIGYELMFKELMINLNLTQAQALDLLHDPGERRAEVAQAIATTMRELTVEIERMADVYTRRYGTTVSRIYTINYSVMVSDFDRMLTELAHRTTQALPLSTVYMPNPVLKAFSTEISGFASAISAIYL